MPPINELFTAKLQPPRLVSDLSPRPRLLERLNRAVRSPVTLVSAPAGFGKTTLLAAWQSTAPLPTAWVSLDKNDNELAVFVSYLVAAIGSLFPNACQATQSTVRAPHLPPPAYLARQLGNDIAELPSEFVLILDDYHVTDNADILALMDALLRHQPAPMHLILSTRVDPPLPLARLRARGQLSEIRQADLSFSHSEVETFFKGALDVELESKTLAHIEIRTEGWAAGLRLAAVALLGRTDPDRHEQWLLHHAEPSMQEFLLNEVFAQQPREIQAFLLETSLLYKFTPELCDAVIAAQSQGSSRGFIEQLGRENLFLITLDETSGWFRFHHLFRDLLDQKRRQEYDVATQSALHLRASCWFAAHGFIVEAIQHALEAGEPVRAAEIIEQNTHRALNSNDHALLERWLALLPSHLLMVRPRLLVAQIYAVALRRGLATLEGYLEALEKLVSKDREFTDAAARVQVQSDILANRCWLYYWQGRFQESVEMGILALEVIPAAHVYARTSTLFYLGLAYQALGQATTALSMLTARGDPDATQSPELTARALNARCTIYWVCADLAQVKRNAQMLYDLGTAHNDLRILSWAHRNLGWVAYEWNQLEAATQHFAFAAQMRFAVNMRTAHESLVSLALTYQARGLPDEANKIAAQLVEYDRQVQYPDALAEAYSLQARLALAQGDLEGAWRALPLSDGPPTGPLVWTEQPQITEILIRLAHDPNYELAPMLDTVTRLLEHARGVHDRRREIQLLAIRALVLHALEETPAALDALAQSLQFAKSGGILRTYVDLGQGIRTLLPQVENGASPYVKRILDAFPSAGSSSHGIANLPKTSKHTPLIEPLTAREMQVLELLARRRTDKEIAAALVISLTTAKTHIRHIFDKLGVNGRRQAVDVARSIGLVAPD